MDGKYCGFGLQIGMKIVFYLSEDMFHRYNFIGN